MLFLEQFFTGFMMDMVSFLFLTIFMLKMAIFYPKTAKMAIIGPHIAICKHQLVPNLTHKGLIWVPQMGRLSIYNGHTSKRNHSHRFGSVKMVYQQWYECFWTIATTLDHMRSKVIAKKSFFAENDNFRL